jgi:hypothetical protein
MRTITILYIVAFSYFSLGILGVFTQVFIIYIFRFFLLDFLKIIFILHEVHVVKGKCYNIYVFN